MPTKLFARALWNYDWKRVLKSDETKVLPIHAIDMFGGKLECIQREAPHAYSQT